MDYTVDVNPLKATYSVKEVFQNGAFKLRGIACAVRFKGSRTFLLTPSAVVEATDNRKKLIAERFSRKHVGGYRLDVSVLGQLGNVTFLRIMKEYPRAMSAMGTSWVIGLNLEIPSSERKALGRLLFGTGAGEFELQAQFDGSTQVIPTKSIDWTSILGVPIIIEHIKSSKKQSGLFSVIGVVGLTSEEKFCLCYFDHKNTGNLDMLLSKLKKAKGPTDIKELVEEEPSTAPAQAMAAINLREHRPSASLETEDQRSWRECGETSTARAQAMAASINLHEQGPSAVMETEDQCSWRECGETSTAQAQAIAAINLREQGPVASLETEDQRSWRECGEAVVNMLIRATRLEKEKQEVVEAFLTQAVHNFVRFTDSCSEDNIGQELRHFTSYLIKAYFVGLVAVRKGSVVIILDCHTLEGLELLWSDYCSGHLDKVAERYLVSEEIKRKLNVETICLETVIEEENYSKCRKALMELPSTSSGMLLSNRNRPEEEETSTAQVQAIAAMSLHEEGPRASLETDDQRSWRECEETSTAQAQAIAAINLCEQGPSASLETEDQRCWREVGDSVVKLFITMKRLEKEKQEFLKDTLTQSVHNYVRFKSCSQDNIGQELMHFTRYLTDAYRVGLIGVHEGSVVIILDCHTLEGLELLWSDYRSGHLDKVAERYLVSEEIKKKLNLETVCLKTVIEVEDYSNCRKALMKLPSSSSGKINSTLEPRQLVRIGGKNDPFERPLRTVSVDFYGNLIPTSTRERFFDFLLDADGEIIPDLSHGLRVHADLTYLPAGCRINPERVWKLQRVITRNYLQKYAVEITMESCGEYVLKPTERMRPETFRQMLRWLPWVKMY